MSIQWTTTKHDPSAVNNGVLVFDDDGNTTHATHVGIPDWFLNRDRKYVIEEKLADDGIWEYDLYLWKVDDDGDEEYVSQPFDPSESMPFAQLGDAMKAAEGLEVLDVVHDPEFDAYVVAERS